MSITLRVEFPGAYYQITSRGNARSEIYLNGEPCFYFLTLLQQLSERFRGFCHPYCLMEQFLYLVLNPLQSLICHVARENFWNNYRLTLQELGDYFVRSKCMTNRVINDDEAK